MKALVELFNNNRIAQIEHDDSMFPVAPGLEWVTCPDVCKNNWSYKDGHFFEPDLRKTPEELQVFYTRLVQEMMDEKVKERYYDGIVSACSYASSSCPRFANEASACILWRDAVWSKCVELINAMKSGEMDVLSKEDFLSMLPTLNWSD